MTPMSFPVGEPLVIEKPEWYGDGLGHLLSEYLEWYRRALLRKCAGLSEEQLRTPVRPVNWSILGLVQHLGWVERRWLHWGFAGRQVDPFPGRAGDGDHSDEFFIQSGDDFATVVGRYHAELRISREIVAGVAPGTASAVGGRFRETDEVPTLGDILFHLVQEYARHVGQVDVVREMIDGQVGE